MFQVKWKSIRGTNLSLDAQKICLAGVSKSTSNQYKTFMKKFETFCKENQIQDFLNPPLESGIELLTQRHKEGLSYNTVNAARSTLSQFIHIKGFSKETDFGKHPLTIKFMEGIFKLNPTKTKHATTWDVEPVLDLFKD